MPLMLFIQHENKKTKTRPENKSMNECQYAILPRYGVRWGEGGEGQGQSVEVKWRWKRK